MEYNSSSGIILANFEEEVEVSDWIDPYDSILLKLFTILVYIIEILASVVMFAFVKYETSGLAGHYRTLINQLLSYLYGVVSTHYLRETVLWRKTNVLIGVFYLQTFFFNLQATFSCCFVLLLTFVLNLGWHLCYCCMWNTESESMVWPTTTFNLLSAIQTYSNDDISFISVHFSHHLSC